MLLETGQDRVLFHRHFETIRSRDICIDNQAIRILTRDLFLDTDLLSVTLFNSIQNVFVTKNGYSLNELQLRDTHLGFMQIGR